MMQIFPLSEGAFTIDQSKIFVPFNSSLDDLQGRPTGSLLVEIQPFLVVTGTDVLLLDTGLGFNDAATSQMQLHTNIRRAGFTPDQVTKVLLSHLHKDHAGGISLEADHTQLSFPNAVYYLQQREWESAMERGAPSYVTEDFAQLQKAEQVHFLTQDTGSISDHVTYEVTGGHSPFHQVFWIKDENQTVFFGGDDAPQLQQMKVRYKTKYDFDPERSLQLRQRWWQEGKEKNWTFLFYHDIKTPVLTLKGEAL